jgi:adenosylcobyric acid synthase
MHNLGIDDEDSVSLEDIGSKYAIFRDADELRLNQKILSNLQPSAFSLQPVIDIVVIKLPRISNFTDFNMFTHEKDVRTRFVDKAENIGKPDLLIIPGTKNTIGDLTFLKERGIFGEIIELSRQGTMTIGICGGYQMLGKQINDPHHVESSKDSIQGLGLLETVTTFAREKQTYQVKAHMLEHENLFHVNDELVGYEIHMGETTYNGHNSVRPFARITERAGEMIDILDGCVSLNGNVIGTYIHGIFDNDEFRSKLIDYLRLKKGLRPSNGRCADFKTIKELRYNELADIVRRNINMNLVYSMMQ